MSNEKNPELNIEPPIVDKSNFEPTEADILKLHYKATYGIIKKYTTVTTRFHKKNW